MEGEPGSWGTLRSGHSGTPLKAGTSRRGVDIFFRDALIPALESLTALGPAILAQQESIMHAWMS